MDLFTLVARLGLDSSEYEKGISGARKSFSSLGDFVSAKAVAFGTMAAHAIEKAANAAVDLGKSAIQAAADVEAQQAQFRATFGTLQGEAEKAFDAISKSTGIFGTRLQSVGTKAFSQFKGAGIDAVEAIGEMERYTTLAADAAAYYDITLEEADEKLRSFLRGNTEAGDAIGLFTSESQRNTAAMDKYGQKWAKLTEAQKQMLMLDISEDIYKQSGAIGQASRESDSWTNVTANLGEAWKRTMALVGAPIKAAITPVIEKITTFLQDEDVQTKFTQFGLTVGTIASQTFTAIEGFIDKLTTPGTGENSILVGIGSFAESVAGIAALVFDDVVTFLKLLTGGADGTDDTMTNIASFITDVATFITDHSEGITTLIESIMAFWAVSNPFAALILALGFIITNWNDIKAAIVMAKNWFTKFIETHVPEGFLQGVIDVWTTIVALVTSAKEMADAFFESLSKQNIQEGGAAVQEGYETGGISGAVSSLWDKTWWNPANLFDTGGRKFATGLDYVPYNDFSARLHEGEAVLTKAEASAWRSGANVQPIDYNAMGAAVGSAVRDALSGIGLYTDDGTRIADMVTDRVSYNIAQRAQSRRFAT